MSTSHVTLIGQDSQERRQIVTVDRVNNALVTIGEIHQNVHRGILYTASATATILGGASADFLMRVPAGGSAHVQFVGAVEHSMRAFLFEGPTTTADGTPVNCHNRNRFSSNTADTLIFSGPTVTADGEQLIDIFIPGGNKNTAGGGSGSSFSEWILAPGDYLMRIANTILTPVADGFAGIEMEFYEPSQSPDTP